MSEELRPGVLNMIKDRAVYEEALRRGIIEKGKANLVLETADGGYKTVLWRDRPEVRALYENPPARVLKRIEEISEHYAKRLADFSLP